MVVCLLLTCLLLTINGLIVTNVFYATRASLPEELRQPRVAQAIVFLGPVLLLLLEWWIFDVATDWLRPAKTSAGDKSP